MRINTSKLTRDSFADLSTQSIMRNQQPSSRSGSSHSVMSRISNSAQNFLEMYSSSLQAEMLQTPLSRARLRITERREAERRLQSASTRTQQRSLSAEPSRSRRSARFNRFSPYTNLDGTQESMSSYNESQSNSHPVQNSDMFLNQNGSDTPRAEPNL